MFSSVRRFKQLDNDFVVINVNSDQWVNDNDNISVKTASFGFGMHIMAPVIGKHTLICFAAGAGFSANNLYTNGYPQLDSIGATHLDLFPDSISYSNNKIIANYFEIPLELRYRTIPDNKGRSFKLNVGVKGGYLFQSHTKYDGDEFRPGKPNEQVKFKEYRIKNLLNYRYGPYIRIGYGKMSVSASYTMTNLFVENKGPVFRYYSIGLSIIPI
ncbi:MAG: hypothetical protein C0594_04410 [Marinilabiliales bacterium]|nr:MAG: hypothetical protein C0594_04410 [Marinilabiliales bacterium]